MKVWYFECRLTHKKMSHCDDFEKYAYLLVTNVIPLFFLNRTHCSTTTVNNATMIARRRPVVEPKVTGERHDVATSALFSYKSDTKMKACKRSGY